MAHISENSLSAGQLAPAHLPFTTYGARQPCRQVLLLPQRARFPELAVRWLKVILPVEAQTGSGAQILSALRFPNPIQSSFTSDPCPTAYSYLWEEEGSTPCMLGSKFWSCHLWISASFLLVQEVLLVFLVPETLSLPFLLHLSFAVRTVGSCPVLSKRKHCELI